MAPSRNLGCSPPRSGGEVARAQPETVRGSVSPRRSAKSLARARALRRGDNMAEAVIWNELKASQLGGFKFVRQMPIGPYFADFACRRAKLIVELDGSQHAGSTYDLKHDAFMHAAGYSVLRVWSHEAIKHTSQVCNSILAVLEGKLTAPVEAPDMRFSPASGEGRR
ncbi:MAG: endonuclease domain-containing protein [Rhizobiaceae bacterium]|nr:endonuclease domain-containing protein [Rhizobiaceae bacterium]